MVIFEDGFDYITVANSTRKWDNATGTLVTGVYGVGSAVQGLIQRTETLPTSYVTGFMSFHYYTDVLTSNPSVICAVLDAGTAQCDLRIDATGKLFFTRNGTTIGSVSTLGLLANTWYWLVVKLTINNTTGVAEVKVDNTSYLTGSGLNNRNTANNSFSQVRLDTSAGRGQRHDNFAFWDTTAGDLTGYPTNELVVDTRLVTGAGADADWTPSAGSNFQNVDEANSNDDTDYNSSTTVGQKDTFAVANVGPAAGTIVNVAVNTIDRRDDPTVHTVSHRVKSSSATQDGTAFTPTSSYLNHQTIFPTDPNTSAAWTVAGRNAANFGYKLIS